jgi:hypothetical protein
MLDKQEQDRKNERLARERRQQAFMNRMADGVLKEQGEIQAKEDQMIEKYQRQRELKLRKEEDKKEKGGVESKEERGGGCRGGCTSQQSSGEGEGEGGRW